MEQPVYHFILISFFIIFLHTQSATSHIYTALCLSLPFYSPTNAYNVVDGNMEVPVNEGMRTLSPNNRRRIPREVFTQWGQSKGPNRYWIMKRTLCRIGKHWRETKAVYRFYLRSNISRIPRTPLNHNATMKCPKLLRERAYGGEPLYCCIAYVKLGYDHFASKHQSSRHVSNIELVVAISDI